MQLNKRNLKSNKAITLIALIVTIIVLLILAGVTIVTLTGDNGLLQKATTAKAENEQAKELELIKLAVSAAQVSGEGTITKDNLENELKINFNDNTITIGEIEDGWSYNSYKIDKSGEVDKLLPKEYQQVEYIESSGTQFINTEIYPKSTTKVIFDFEYIEPGGGNGWGSAERNEAFLFGANKRGFWSIISNRWGNDENTSYTNIAFNQERHKYVLESGNQLFDGIKYGSTTIGDTATNKQYMYLFAEHWEWDNRAGNYSKRSRRFL